MPSLVSAKALFILYKFLLWLSSQITPTIGNERNIVTGTVKCYNPTSKLAELCSGSTGDFGSSSPGSNPGSAASKDLSYLSSTGRTQNWGSKVVLLPLLIFVTLSGLFRGEPGTLNLLLSRRGMAFASGFSICVTHS